MESITILKEAKSSSYNPNFVSTHKDHVKLLNNWRMNFTVDNNLNDIVEYLKEQFELTCDPDSIVLRRVKIVENKRGKPENKWYTIDINNIKTIKEIDEAAGREPSLLEWNISVRTKMGDVVVESVNCDGRYMIECMERAGKKIREHFHYVPPTTPIYLQGDNAGGHGTDDNIKKYTKMLKDDYNIILFHQPSNSPDFNANDLGFYNAMQSIVTKLMVGKRKNMDSLDAAISGAWHSMSRSVLRNVFDFLPSVMSSCILDEGRNTLCESFRGKKFEAELTRITALRKFFKEHENLATMDYNVTDWQTAECVLSEKRGIITSEEEELRPGVNNFDFREEGNMFNCGDDQIIDLNDLVFEQEILTDSEDESVVIENV